MAWIINTYVKLTYLVSSMYTDSRTVAAYSKFFFKSTTEASPLSNCFTKDRNLREKDKKLVNIERNVFETDYKILSYTKYSLIYCQRRACEVCKYAILPNIILIFWITFVHKKGHKTFSSFTVYFRRREILTL